MTPAASLPWEYLCEVPDRRPRRSDARRLVSRRFLCSAPLPPTRHNDLRTVRTSKAMKTCWKRYPNTSKLQGCSQPALRRTHVPEHLQQREQTEGPLSPYLRGTMCFGRQQLTSPEWPLRHCSRAAGGIVWSLPGHCKCAMSQQIPPSVDCWSQPLICKCMSVCRCTRHIHGLIAWDVHALME
jgi:hypothetical protein